MTNKLWALVVLSIAVPATAQRIMPANLPEYSSVSELMLLAIRNTTAKGRLVGPVADKFTLQFASQGELVATATAVQSLPQEGCMRIKVEYVKSGVATPKGPTEARLTMFQNFCTYGGPPGGAQQ